MFISEYVIIKLLIKLKSLGILTVFLSIVIISSIGVYAEVSDMPDWIKSNGKWWIDGQTEEPDSINAMQYLITRGIPIPITEVTATTTNLDESETAQSFVVTFSGGDHFTAPVTIYSYSQFLHFSETINSDDVSSFQDTPIFLLRSLPSDDKKSIYDLVNEYVNAGQKPEMFDVNVDVMSGNGSITQTWEYRRCDVVDYATYVNDEKDEYRFAGKDKAEIRDVLVIECGGFSLST